MHVLLLYFGSNGVPKVMGLFRQVFNVFFYNDYYIKVNPIGQWVKTLVSGMGFSYAYRGQNGHKIWIKGNGTYNGLMDLPVIGKNAVCYCHTDDCNGSNTLKLFQPLALLFISLFLATIQIQGIDLGQIFLSLFPVFII